MNIQQFISFYNTIMKQQYKVDRSKLLELFKKCGTNISFETFGNDLMAKVSREISSTDVQMMSNEIKTIKKTIKGLQNMKDPVS